MNSSTAATNFEVVCSYLGWGDPGGPDRPALWFIGLEEGTTFTQASVDGYRGCRFKEKASPTWPVSAWVSKVACQVSARYSSQDWLSAWREYRRHLLWRRNSRVAQLNLFPLGRPNRKTWPDHYARLFGFGPNDRIAYREQVKAQRFPNIMEAWQEARPQAVVCFGKGEWSRFQSVFHVADFTEDDGMRRSDQHHLLLTRFFGQGMSNSDAQMIGDQLKAWNVSIP